MKRSEGVARDNLSTTMTTPEDPMNDTTTPLAEGALARLTRDLEPMSQHERRQRAGLLFRIEDYVTAEQSEDGVAFYWGSSNTGINDVCVPADAVEQVMTPQQARARRPPGLPSLLRYLGSALLDDGDDFKIHETNQREEHDRSVTAYGTTDDGIRFAVVVAVESVMEVDL